MRIRSILAAAVLVLALPLAAQEPAIEFDAASIKVNKKVNAVGTMSTARAFFRMTNQAIATLILSAYHLEAYQLTGAPDWVHSEHNDVEARYEFDSSLGHDEATQKLDLRFQALLASRFAFRMHRETKELRSYALVEGKKGSKLTPTTLTHGGTTMRMSNGHVEIRGVRMENFARNLTGWLDRPVVDETGINGRFDITLDFDQSIQASADEKGNPIGGVGGRPSLHTALQDELGLRLESRKAPTQVLVVDHIERPSEN